MSADSSPNTSLQRAIRAEKRVERLERELSSLKTRLKDTSTSGTKGMDLSGKDRVVFQLNEQVKDLKYQLSVKTEEYTHLQETTATKAGEYETKLKKMREIFAQATKNIDKYRSTINSQEQTIARVNDELAETQLKLSDMTDIVSSQKVTLGILESELKETKTNSRFEIDQLEASKRQLASQLEQTKSDYEQYKKRANQLLQQKSNQADDTRLSDLQNQIKQFEMLQIGYETERAERERKIALMDLDIRQALDRIRELQERQTFYQNTKSELDGSRRRVEYLEKQMLQDREEFEKKLKAAKEIYDTTLQQLSTSSHKPRLQADDSLSSSASEQKDTTDSPSMTPEPVNTFTDSHQQEQEAAMETIMEYLNEDNTRLRQQLKEKEQICIELQHKILVLQQQQQGQEDDEVDQAYDKKGRTIDATATQQTNDNHVDVYESMIQLLSPLVSRQETKDINYEEQVKQLKDLLQESEDQVTALRRQETLLKNEIRKLDSVDKRQNMSVEYIKNVLLKFLTADNKEFLVPVLAKVLFLDPQETEQLRRAV